MGTSVSPFNYPPIETSASSTHIEQLSRQSRSAQHLSKIVLRAFPINFGQLAKFQDKRFHNGNMEEFKTVNVDSRWGGVGVGGGRSWPISPRTPRGMNLTPPKTNKQPFCLQRESHHFTDRFVCFEPFESTRGVYMRDT